MVSRHFSSSFVLSRAASCALLLSVLVLCDSAAAQLISGERCDLPGSSCAEGLLCVPETPGSTVRICRDSSRPPCATERCPRVWCGPRLQYVPKGECCPICPPLPTIHTPPTITVPTTCSENGAEYAEGETWQRDSCTTCTCYAGVPLCSSVQCEIPAGCEHLVMTPGQCCPTCASSSTPALLQCVDNGERYGEGESWNRNRDPCISCICIEGETLCSARHCYVDCENPVFLPDTCCPICPDDGETGTHLPVPIATSLPPPPPPTLVLISPPAHCEDGGQVYENGATWNPNGDACTSCRCEEGLKLCLAQSCYAACETKDQVFLPGVCCPICPGDEGYPSTSVPTSQPVPSTTTQTASSSHTITLSPTPTASDATSPTTDSTPTIITATSPSEKPPTICKDTSGVEWSDGASWCPTPSVRATCHSGAVSYSEHHCQAVTCEEPSWTVGSCDCPVCPDDPAETPVVISAVLDMEYSRYLSVEESVTDQLIVALNALGLKVVDIEAASYGQKQTQVIISVLSEGEDKALLEDEEYLQALLDQFKSPPVASVKVGHHDEPKSITGVSNPQVQSSSTSQSGGPHQTAAIVAATLTVSVALVCAAVIVVVVTRVRRMRAVPKTTTVV